MIQKTVSSRSLLELVNLTGLMERTHGHPSTVLALLDGPVAENIPELQGARLHGIGGPLCCTVPRSGACAHGTFVAAILAARRGGVAPAICPGATLLVRPLFRESETSSTPQARPEDLATAIEDAI